VNLLQKIEFSGDILFRCKNICGISTENYVLCIFKLEKDRILVHGSLEAFLGLTKMTTKIEAGHG
jgi:hypothetical protein